MKKTFAAFLFFLLPLSVSAANIIFNEIAWMGMAPRIGETAGAASNNEWMELKNTSGDIVYLAGWKIIGEGGSPNISLSGSIVPNGYFLLERSTTTFFTIPADLAYPYKDNALSNSGEHLYLKDPSGNIMDEINATSGWPAGDNSTKETMQRSGTSWITAPATPRGPNSGSSSDPASSALPSSAANVSPAATSSSLSGGVVLMPPGRIKAFAGEDQTAGVGSEVIFSGSALGLKDEPLENVRFLWNFGDGEIQEGRTVSHIYQVPGTYTTGLYVASGLYTASDYARISVIPNLLRIADVIPGDEGYLKISNGGNADIDIGEWQMVAGDKKFLVPTATKIAARSQMSFANRTTKLLSAPVDRVAFFYPNGVLAFDWQQRAIPIQSQVINVSITPAALHAPVGKRKLDVLSVASTTVSSTTTAAVSAPLKNYNLSPKIFFGIGAVVSMLGAVSFLIFKKLFSG